MQQPFPTAPSLPLRSPFSCPLAPEAWGRVLCTVRGASTPCADSLSLSTPYKQSQLPCLRGPLPTARPLAGFTTLCVTTDS